MSRARKPWTRLMARYKMPSITHAPEVVSHIVEHPVSTGPFGAKGVGELPSIPTSASITNAIHRATGVRVRSLPVDQDELLRAIRTGADTVELGRSDDQVAGARRVTRISHHGVGFAILD